MAFRGSEEKMPIGQDMSIPNIASYLIQGFLK